MFAWKEAEKSSRVATSSLLVIVELGTQNCNYLLGKFIATQLTTMYVAIQGKVLFSIQCVIAHHRR